MFSREQNGYSVSEVDMTLARLRAEYEAKLVEKDETISSLEKKIHSLQDIVLDYVQREEKTQSILESTQNVRSLEEQRLQLLYKKWNTTLQQLKSKVVPIISSEELVNLTQDFQYALKVIVDSSTSSKHTTVSYAKSVLTRMTGIVSQSEKTSKRSVPHLSKKDRVDVFNAPEDVLSSQKTPSQAEKFLNGETNSIPKSLGLGREKFSIPPKEFIDGLSQKKEKGFSLEEALTPKESLEEIMTAFNLDD